MSERDLIERLEEATLQWLELRDEENAALAQEASDAIARLSEALAEAEKKGAEAAATIEALQNPWSSDMSAMPRGQDVLVYQPPHKAGCDTIPARICELRNSGYARVSTHWMLPAPPRDLSQGGQHG